MRRTPPAQNRPEALPEAHACRTPIGIGVVFFAAVKQALDLKAEAMQQPARKASPAPVVSHLQLEGRHRAGLAAQPPGQALAPSVTITAAFWGTAGADRRRSRLPAIQSALRRTRLGSRAGVAEARGGSIRRASRPQLQRWVASSDRWPGNAAGGGPISPAASAAAEGLGWLRGIVRLATTWPLSSSGSRGTPGPRPRSPWSGRKPALDRR